MYNHGNAPLPHNGPISNAKLDKNLLTACPNPWTSSDNNLENKAKEISNNIGILAKSKAVPTAKYPKLDLSPGSNFGTVQRNQIYVMIFRIIPNKINDRSVYRLEAIVNNTNTNISSPPPHK